MNKLSLRFRSFNNFLSKKYLWQVGLFFFFVISSELVQADPYQISIQSKDSYLYGYANIEADKSRNVAGLICLLGENKLDDKSGSSKYIDLIAKRLNVKGKVLTSKLMQITISGTDTRFPLIINLNIGTGSFPFQIHNSGGPPGWEFRSQLDRKHSKLKLEDLSLIAIPFDLKGANLSFEMHDKVYAVKRVVGKKAISQSVQLSELSRMEVEAARSFSLKNVPDSLINPGSISAIIETAKFEELKNYYETNLKKIGVSMDFDFFDDISECSPPNIEINFSVPIGLEFYVAALLQESGKVVTAYPEELARDPMLVTLMAPFALTEAQFFLDPSNSKPERDKTIDKFLTTQITNFFKLRRPKQSNLLKLTRVMNGDASVASDFRYTLIGPSQTACDANVWEKINVVFLPRPYIGNKSLGMELVMQTLQSYFAPGQLDESRIPSDARFQENPISDGKLAEWQAMLSNFMYKKGFVVDNSDQFKVNGVVSSCTN